jgi:RNA-binding protein
MPAPINPKKRSLMGASKLRKALRAAGHHLQPIVQVGKEGLTESVLAQLSEALDHHELVKVKVGTESPEDRFEVAERLAEAEDVQLAQVIGRTILTYRKHARTPRFEPLDAADRERIAEEDAERAARAANAKPARRRRTFVKRPESKRPPPKRYTPGRPPSKRPGSRRPAPKRG